MNPTTPTGRWLRSRAALATGVLVLMLAGCSGSASEASGDAEVALRFATWSNNEDHLAMLDGFEEEFQETHPEVTVEFVPVPIGEYLRKVTISLAGGRPFDAGWLGEGDVAELVAQDVLADISPAMDQLDEYDLDDFTDKAMTNWVSGDEVYGVPFSTSPFFIYYNKTLFDEAGVDTPDILAEQGEWTWTRFAEVAGQITEASEAGVYGFEGQDGNVYENPTNFWNTVLPTIRAHGGSLWDIETGSCELSSPGTVEALQMFQQMAIEDQSMVPPGQQSSFFAGQAGMTINQLSRASQLDEAPFEWGTAPLPSGPEGTSDFYGQAGIVAFSASEHVDIAAELVAFMTTKANVETMAEFFPPARQSVLESEAFLTGNPRFTEEQMTLIANQVSEGDPFPFPENHAEMNLALAPAFEGLWQDGADVQGVLEEACSIAEPLLQN